MLRKRSRAVTSKQAKIGDQNNNLQWSPCEKQTKPISYFFYSPRIFKGFLSIGSQPPQPPPQPPQPPQPPSSSEAETTTMSPTSILDGKHFSILPNIWMDTKIPNSATKNMTQNKHSWDQLTNNKGIGLALVDENLYQQQQQYQLSNSCLKQKSKLVVFGSQLKIQVPPLPPSSVLPCFSPESPREFGIKTPRSLLRTFSGIDSHHQVHAIGDCKVGKEAENISVSEMEESEDYTCVISHGPNPKTTHIFGNCIVGSCCGINPSSSLSSRRSGCLSPLGVSAPSSEPNFLSYCHHCKKHLAQGNDIFIYRGEKAFCSQECRCQEMLYDDGVES